jgi:hypothetical protein
MKELDTKKKNILLFAVIMTLTLLWNVIFHHEIYHGLFGPVSGFAVTVYYLHGKKALPSVLLGLLTGFLISLLIFFNRYNADHNLFAFSTIIIILLEMIIFRKLMIAFHLPSNRIPSFFEIVKFTLIIIITALLGAALRSGVVYLLYNSFTFNTIFEIYFLSEFTVIIVFSSQILNSYFRDEPCSFHVKRSLEGILFLFLFVSLIYLAFYDYNKLEGIYNVGFVYLFSAYVFASYRYTFRMLVIMTTLLFMAIFYFLFSSTSLTSLDPILLSYMIYVFVMVITSNLTRTINLERLESFKNLLVFKSPCCVL